MAIIDKKGRLHGKLGKVAYRVLKNQIETVSTICPNVKQTAATKASGLEFGLASSSACVIRTAFSALTYRSDPGMINRLNSQVLRSIKGSQTKIRGERDLHDGDLSLMNGFQFNNKSSVAQVLPVRPECLLTEENLVQVHLKAFNDKDLKLAAGSYNCNLQLILMVINFKAGYYETLDHANFSLNADNCSAGIDWQPEVQVPAGCIAMVSLSLNCYNYNRDINSNIFLNSTEFNPAEIIGAFSVASESAVNTTSKNQNSRIISDYKGKSIFERMEKLRLKDFRSANRDKVTEDPHPLLQNPEPAKGKVFFRKE